MERSRLPLPSLLGLFGALLMLSPEQLMGKPRVLSNVSINDSQVQKALAFTMQQYNQRRRNSANLFKVLRILKAQSQVDTRDEYDFTVEVVETKCKKWALWTMNYERLQKCQQLPGNQKIRTCYFKVILSSPANLAVTACT